MAGKVGSASLRTSLLLMVVATAAVALVAAIHLRGAEAQAAGSVLCDDTQDGCSNQAEWRYFKNPDTEQYDARGHYYSGGNATFTFTGTSIKWITWKCSSCGKAEIYLDGQKVSTFDGYSPSTAIGKVGYSKTGLTNKKHTLKIVSKGRNSSSFGNTVLIDEFRVGSKVYQQTDYRIAFGDRFVDDDGVLYSGVWKGVYNANAVGKSYRESTSTTIPAAFFTYGNPVSLRTAVGPGYGTARVEAWTTAEDGSNLYAGSTTITNAAATFAFKTRKLTFRDDIGQEVMLNPEKYYAIYVISEDGKPVVVDAWYGTPGAAPAALDMSASSASKEIPPHPYRS